MKIGILEEQVPPLCPKVMPMKEEVTEGERKQSYIYYFCFYCSWAKHVKFDVVLYEMMWMTPYLAFVHTIGSPPVIGVSTLDNNFLFDGLMGSPANPTYMPAFLPFSDHMSFMERLINLYHFCLFCYYRDW